MEGVLSAVVHISYAILMLVKMAVLAKTRSSVGISRI